MALAELRSNDYRIANSGPSDWKQKENRLRHTATHEAVAIQTFEIGDSLEWKRVKLQARRPVELPQMIRSNLPVIDTWIRYSVWGVFGSATAFAISALFIFLLELPVGRAGVIMWSFSGTALFATIALVSWRISRSIEHFSSDRQEG